MDMHTFVKSTCKELGLNPHKIIIITDSNMNAFVAMDTIMITSGLVRALTEDELCAVVAHELGHSYHKHGTKRLAITGGRMVLSGINWFLPLPIWKKVLIEVSLGVAQMAIQRPIFHQQEFEADEMCFRFNLQKPMVSALRKLQAEQVKQNVLPEMLSFLGTMTHPDTEERIKRLDAPFINR